MGQCLPDVSPTSTSSSYREPTRLHVNRSKGLTGRQDEESDRDGCEKPQEADVALRDASRELSLEEAVRSYALNEFKQRRAQNTRLLRVSQRMAI